MDTDSALENNPHVKDLQKNIRNVNKKLAGMAKVDAIIADNPNLTLDDLVQTRKINADQRAQALKKPQLQAQLLQYEEQLVLHKKLEEDFQSRLQEETSRLKAAHEKELETLRKEATPAVPEPKPVVEQGPSVRDSLLALSLFLRAAASRRQGDDESSEESRAFEGMLLLLYGGDVAAVDAAEKLITGSSDGVPSTEGDTLSVSYARVKELSMEYSPFAIEESWVHGVTQADQSLPERVAAAAEINETDPTIAHATPGELRHLQSSHARKQPNGTSPLSPETPQQSGVGDAAGNAAAIEHWNQTINQTSADPMAESWVSVPRDPQEVESPAAPVQHGSTQNWADETNHEVQQAAAAIEASSRAAATTTASRSSATAVPAIGASSDGFHEVHHGRAPRGRGHGGPEGRGRGRGGFRGGDRGGRGDRGGYRGDRGDRGHPEGGYRSRGGRGSRGRPGARDAS